MCCTLVRYRMLGWLSKLVNADFGWFGSSSVTSGGSGACKSPLQGLERLNTRGFWWSTAAAALPDERECIQVSIKLCFFCQSGTAALQLWRPIIPNPTTLLLTFLSIDQTMASTSTNVPSSIARYDVLTGLLKPYVSAGMAHQTPYSSLALAISANPCPQKVPQMLVVQISTMVALRREWNQQQHYGP